MVKDEDRLLGFKILSISILLTSIGYCGDAWLGDCDFLCISGLLAIPGLIILFIIWVFVSALDKNNSANSFFSFLTILLFSIILLSIVRESISSYIEHESYTPKHNFMQGYQYGEYEENGTIEGKGKYPIIDLYLEEYTYTSYRRNLSFLQKNGIFNCDDGEHIIDLNRSDITMAYCQSGGRYLKLYNEDKRIQIYDINSSKLLGRYNKKVPKTVSLKNDYILNQRQSDYRTKSSWFDDDYRKLYVDHLNQTDKDIFSERKIFVYINKNTQEMIPYYNGVSYQSTKINAVPLLAQYDNEKDIIYVVYENASDIKILVNKFSKIYTDVENIIKQSIDYTYLPWWNQEDEPNQLDTKMSNKINEFFDNKHTDVEYHVRRETNNTFYVTVNIEQEPYRSMVFRANNLNQTKIDSIVYKDRVYGKEIIEILVDDIKNVKSELEIVRLLLKFEIAILHTTSEEGYRPNPNFDDSAKVTISDRITHLMKNRFYGELKKDIKSYERVKNIEKKQEILLSYNKMHSKDCLHYTYNINKCTQITFDKVIRSFETRHLLKEPVDSKYVNIIQEIDISEVNIGRYDHPRVMKKYHLNE